ESNERQLQIINDLLYVAKVEAGRIILTRRMVNLSELVSKVVDEQRSSADEKNITVKVKLPPKPLYASIDQHTMWMAVENLVSNAIKYTHKNGNVRITLRTQRDQICLIVTDTGIGISEEQQKDLFKQFSRIPNELTQETTGSGIGLFLARHLVELHGGTITVKSQDAKGSSFVIWLPGSLRVKAPKKK
ncbi:histidine kinase, partial [Candidatus Saccharibacteria bacterium]